MARGVLSVARTLILRFHKTAQSRLGWSTLEAMRADGIIATTMHGGGGGVGSGGKRMSSAVSSAASSAACCSCCCASASDASRAGPRSPTRHSSMVTRSRARPVKQRRSCTRWACCQSSNCALPSSKYAFQVSLPSTRVSASPSPNERSCVGEPPPSGVDSTLNSTQLRCLPATSLLSLHYALTD